jgi:ABC-type amino acid transport substrate-binding protein
MLDDIRSRGTIRIGVSLGGEPIGFRDDQNNPVGYDVDVAKRLAEKIGVPVEFTDVSGDARISMLVSGQIDVAIANTSATLERAKVVNFSIPYNRAGLRIIVQKDAGIKDLKDLAGKKIVVGRGTTGETFLKTAVPDAELVYVDQFAPDGVLQLQQKRVDAAIEDSSLLDYLATKNPTLVTLAGLYSNDPIGMAVAKGDPEFVRWLDMFVSDYIQSGAYEANYKKWWGAEANPPALNPQW